MIRGWYDSVVSQKFEQFEKVRRHWTSVKGEEFHVKEENPRISLKETQVIN